MVQVSDRGQDGAVSELLGDDADVESLLTELRGVRVAEAVGVDALVDVGEACQRREQAADVAGGERLAFPRAEERLAIGDGPKTPVGMPKADKSGHAGIDAAEAVAVALAVEDADGACFEVDVLGVEGERFAESSK